MEKRIIVKRGCRREVIRLTDIIFMEKEQRKIYIHMGTDIISFYGRYGEIEEALDERFTSPHRSYMINMDYIVTLSGSEVIMGTGHVINLCRACMNRLKKTYDIYVAKNLANP